MLASSLVPNNVLMAVIRIQAFVKIVRMVSGANHVKTNAFTINVPHSRVGKSLDQNVHHVKKGGGMIHAKTNVLDSASTAV